MRLTFLGTSASVPTPTRDTNHYVVESDDGSVAVLVDAGGSTYHHLRRIGLEPAELSAAILTHHHADHVGGFPMLAQALQLLPDPVRMPVYGPPETLAVARRLCEILGVETGGPGLTVDWREIRLGEEPAVFVVADALRISAIRSVHSLPCAALAFEQLRDGVRLVSSSDSCYNPALTRLAAGCDLLIHDCIGPTGTPQPDPPNHATAEEVARTADEAAVAALMPMHVVEPLLPEVLRILRERVACPVLEPRDLAPLRIAAGRVPFYEER